MIGSHSSDKTRIRVFRHVPLLIKHLPQCSCHTRGVSRRDSVSGREELGAEEGDEVIEELALTDGIAIVMTDNLTPQADQLRGS